MESNQDSVFGASTGACAYVEPEQQTNKIDHVNDFRKLGLSDNVNRHRYFLDKFRMRSLSVPNTEDDKYFSSNIDGDSVLFVAIMNCYKNKSAQKHAIAIINKASSCKQLNYANRLRQTAIILAAIADLPRVVHRLLVGGARLDAIDTHGNTALHISCEYGYVRCVEELMTPVCHTEAHINRYNAPMQFIPQGMEIHNCDGLAPIHLAAARFISHGEFEAFDCIKILERCGADINVHERKAGKTVVHMAAENNNIELLCLLLSLPHLNLNVTTFAGYSAIELALERGYLMMVDKLKRAIAGSSRMQPADPIPRKPFFLKTRAAVNLL